MDMNKNWLIAVAVVVVLGVGGYMVLQGGSKPSTSVVTSPTQMTAPVREAKEPTEGEIVVEGDEYKFLPSSISLTAGEKVKITYKNTGNVPHNLVIDELGVETATIVGGKTASVEVTPTKTGTYTFYCSVGNHRALGMEGMMEVK